MFVFLVILPYLSLLTEIKIAVNTTNIIPKITKKIKKEDKMKYIDQLTSLKNRNYLNENIANWNKNTIYPQATIIIDLNQVRNINDTLGYEQGDAQIKAAANVLIKTQLDNTDIMRTDGNEYLIYLVGYQEKQVVSYIRKLYKEFKNLPYEHGAAIGYSMIMSNHPKGNEWDSRHIRMRREGAVGVSSCEGYFPESHPRAVLLNR